MTAITVRDINRNFLPSINCKSAIITKVVRGAHRNDVAPSRGVICDEYMRPMNRGVYTFEGTTVNAATIWHPLFICGLHFALVEVSAI